MKKSLWIIFSSFMLLAISSSGCTLTSTSVSISSDGSGDFATIEEAIEEIEPNTIILLDEGRFELSGPLLIEKSLTIQGVGAGQTIISNASGGSPVIYFDGENLTMKDVSLERTGQYASNIMVVKSGEVSLENCKLSGGAASDDSVQGDGLWLRGTSNVTVNNCVFENNMGIGVVATENARVTINQVNSSNNQIGIAFFNNSSGEIQSSNVSNNQEFGILVYDLAQVNIVDNTIINNGAEGIYFRINASNGEVRNNNLEKNDQNMNGTDIRILEAYAPALLGNTCDGSGKSSLGGDLNGIVFIGRNSLPANPTLEGNSCMVAKCTTSTGTLFSLECK